MNWKLALALLLVNLAAFSMVATCNENVQMDVDPRMTMLMIDPFPEDELNDLMLDTSAYQHLIVTGASHRLPRLESQFQ